MRTMDLKKGRFARFPIILYIVALPLLFLYSFRIVFADPPSAIDDTTYSTTEDTTLVITPTYGVLSNDLHEEGEAVLLTAPLSRTGTLDFLASGAFTYIPLLNFNGVVTFSYYVSQTGGFSDTANVTITVTAVNDAPIARDDNNTTNEDTILIVDPPGVLSNDSDVDVGDILSVVDFDANSSNGAVTVTLDGGYTYDPTTAPTLNALAAGQIITDTFTYTISDSGGLTDTAVVSITVTGLNDAPVLDNSGSLTLNNINEDETDNIGTSVGSIIASGGDPITDVDNGALEGIAVTGITNNNGIWQYRLNGGSWQPFGAVSDNNALLLDTADYIRFVPNADYNGSSGPISFHAWDQTAGSSGGSVVPNGGTTPYSTAVATATLTVNPVNDAPVLDNSAGMTLTPIDEDQVTNGDTVAAIIASAGGDRITDVDAGAQEGIAVTSVDNTNGTWYFSTNGGASWGNFTIPLNNATLLNTQSRIRFVPALHYFGSASINFRAWDQTPGFGSLGHTVVVAQTGGTTAFSTAVATATLTIDPVNDAPSLDLNGSGDGVNYNVTFTEDGGPVSIVGANLSISDVDNTDLASAQAVLTNPLDGTAESLAVTAAAGITAVYSPTTGILSLTGTAPITSYETVLRTLTYNNTSQDPTTTGRVVAVTVNDGVDNSIAAYSFVTINAINDNPVLATNTTLPANQGSTVPILGYLEVTDLDNSPSEIVYTIITLPSHGDLLLSSLPLAVNDTFTQADINGNILKYSNDGTEFNNDSFTFTVADGSGGSIGVTTFNISVNVNNFTPVLAVNAGLTVNEGATGLITSSRLLVTDADNTAAQLTYRVEITPAHGTLLLNNVPLVINDTFTQADINNAKVAYAHDGSETLSDNFTFFVSDGVGGTIDSTIFNITVNPVNDAPVVDLNGSAAGLNFAADFTEGGGAAPIVASTLSVSDPDTTNLVGATAVLVNRPDGTAESLSINTGGTGILASYNPSTGVLSLAGLNTVGNYQTVLRSLKYNNTSQNPATTNRIVNVTVHDGSLSSSIAASTITIHPVNNPPVLLINATLTVDYGYTGVINASLLKLTDVDNTPAELVFTVKSLPSNGQLRLNGVPLTVNGTFTQVNLNDGLLTYTHNKTNTESDSFQFTAVDGDGGSISQKTFAIVINPQPVVYLPVILNNYVYGEPNDTACEAFGITFNNAYQFLPDDVEDWYKFSLAAVSNVTVQISNYTPSDGQMIVYSGTNCGAINQIKQASNITPGNSLVLNGLAAGTYYVRVYTAAPPSNPTPYTLQVVKP